MKTPNSRVAPSLHIAVRAETLGEDQRIRFRCHRGVACWNACCSNIDIALTPYDIVRLKQRLNITSTEFLARYAIRYEIERDCIGRVKLRTLDGTTACRFLTREGCSVYADRPAACRSYPVAASPSRHPEAGDHGSYALVREPHCLGHDEPREIAIGDYRSEQGLPEYDALNRGWHQLILRQKSLSNPSGPKLSKHDRALLFTACYDVDRFRGFVASEAFAERFDVPADGMHTILTDDVALMLFGFRFVRQTLFGEVTIPTRQPASGRFA